MITPPEPELFSTYVSGDLNSAILVGDRDIGRTYCERVDQFTHGNYNRGIDRDSGGAVRGDFGDHEGLSGIRSRSGGEAG